MPRFFFDSDVNGRRLDDDEGVELKSLDDAKREGLATVLAMASEMDVPTDLNVVFRVRDDSHTLMKIEMSLKISS